MKKLFANLRRNSENNKGFSLVELIIVIAIMVALVAMLSPQFVKYVTKSRDAVVQNAAEDVLAMTKTESAFGVLKQTDPDLPGTITVRAENGNGPIELVLENITYNGKSDGTAQLEFEKECGVDKDISTRSTLYYTITIEGSIHAQESGRMTIQVEMESETGTGNG